MTTKRLLLLGGFSLLLAAFVAAGGKSSKPELTYRFSHLAGPSPEAVDGVGRAARFKRPTGIALDGRGNLIVADAGQHAIRKVSAGGVVTTLAGAAGERGMRDGAATDARFDTPSGVAVDAGGHVFVADRGNACIRRISPTGVVATFAGQPGARGSLDGLRAAARFEEPVGIAIDVAGNLYVADAGSHTVRKIDPSGYVSTLAGAPGIPGHVDAVGGDARFRAPISVAVSRAGTVYVVAEGMLRMIDTVGKVSTGPKMVPLPGYEPFGGWQAVTVDSNGRVYAACFDAIRRLEDDGSISPIAGQWIGGTTNFSDGMGEEAAFGEPAGLTIDAAGNIFVADTGNSAIRRVTPNGETSTIAGGPEASHADGPSSLARFHSPGAMAVARDGTMYVADTGNYVIRRISVDGEVTTLAGAVGRSDYVDGVGAAARFGPIVSMALDREGNLVLADGRIRRVSPAGVVTTLGNVALAPRNVSGAQAIFGQPTAVAVDRDGNVLFADGLRSAILKISGDGTITTVATGTGDGSHPRVGSGVTFRYPTGLAIDREGNIYVAATTGSARMEFLYGVVKIGPGGVASLLVEDQADYHDPTPEVVHVVEAARLFMDAQDNLYVSSHAALSRIEQNGTVSVLVGPDSAIGEENAPGQRARFNHPQGIAADRAGNLYIADTGNHAIRLGVPRWENSDTRLAALSVRSRAGAGDQTLIMGFAVAGADTHDVLVRGLGPTLTDTGLDDVVRDPKLQVFDRGELVAQNDNWSAELMPLFARLGAGSPRQASKDAALMSSLSAGAYTAHVVATGSDEGVALAEVFDADLEGEGRLKALAVRSRAGVGNDILIAGFVLVGNAPKTVLIRAVGPSLAQHGVSGVLVDPRLRLFHGIEEIGRNDDWGGTAWLKEAFTQTGLGGFESDSSKDAALLVSLEPGVYTVHVSGAEGGTGVSLVEVYTVE